MSVQKPSNFRKIIILTALIISGETVFVLPFVSARIFRPTFLSVFGINNLQLGTAFSLYGFIAMVSYFAGGPLADRFSARRLMTLALIATSLGGVIMASIPDLGVLTLLYGFWGLTSILLFWAALIRATREWGGPTSQGKAYGLLDGGRGLFAAFLASISVWIFATLLPSDPSVATIAQLQYALSRIIWIFSILTIGVAIFVWVSIPERKNDSEIYSRSKLSLDGIRMLLWKPTIWLQAIIVLCAYVGYKCTDDFSLYASDAFGYNDVDAAQIGTIGFWMRPIAAVSAGFLGDYIRASRMVITSFAIMIIGSLVITMGIIQPGMHIMLILTIVGISAGIYALRGVYFALLQEARVPILVTGSAVGIVSVVGFTPDVFMGPLMGYLIDNSPGVLGHQHVFAVLAAFGFIGLLASYLFYRITIAKLDK
jgi:MFS family permease